MNSRASEALVQKTAPNFLGSRVVGFWDSRVEGFYGFGFLGLWV